MDALLRLVLIGLTSYLLGAIPTAYFVARQQGVNIFEVGSGNMGATNVGRAMGFWWGVLVWVLDSTKGVLAVLLALTVAPDNPAGAAALAALAAIIGHNWSILAVLVTGKLRGGKGASIWFGTMIILALLNIALLQVVLSMSVLGGFIIAVTRYVSLAVLAMFGLSTLWMLVLIGQRQLPVEFLYYTVPVAGMMLYRFRENIQRLLSGTERRLGERV